MHIRYVIIDESFFLLVEPEIIRMDEYRVKVHKKV